VLPPNILHFLGVICTLISLRCCWENNSGIKKSDRKVLGKKGENNNFVLCPRNFGEKWLYTGDVARMDEDGYFTIVDRTKDMINVSGYKVFSRWLIGPKGNLSNSL